MSVSALAKNLIGVVNRPAPMAVLWEGPCSNSDQGGVTQSLLGRWLACRERARLYLVEGWRSSDRFMARIEYGSMWHCAEEALAHQKLPTGTADQMRDQGLKVTEAWQLALEQYCRQLLQRYPFQQQEVEHWYEVCCKQFPEYVKYWRQHPDVTNRTPLLAEQVFDVPYKLPSGRVVRLRGKWDSVDLVTDGGVKSVWLQENKSKSQVDEQQIKRQLTSDIQSMLYLVALRRYAYQRTELSGGRPPNIQKDVRNYLIGNPIRGVRYNVIKLPLSGGKGTIVRREATEGSKCAGCDGVGSRTMYAGTKREVHEPKCGRCEGRGKVGAKPGETREEYYERVAAYIRENPEEYFFRWNVEVTDDDIAKFCHEVLDPMLEQLCDWYEWVSSPAGIRDPFANRVHFKQPYGFYSSIAEGVVGDYDTMLASGSTLGLTKVDELFRELKC